MKYKLFTTTFKNQISNLLSKKILLLVITLLGIGITNAQIVNIPDANFKAYLVGNTAINTNGDTEIQVSEANAFTGPMNCFNLSISDLTGIEAFTSLTYINCRNNQLTSIDLSSNSSLNYFNCNDNQITSINVFNNILLEEIHCRNNQLSTLDITNNSALEVLVSDNNSISTLNLSNKPNLFYLSFRDNQIATIDVTTNTALVTFDCTNNQLSSLDITNNTLLTRLYANSNQLTAIDVASNTALTELSIGGPSQSISALSVSNNTALKKLWIEYQGISTLNLSTNTALEELYAQNSQLSSLDISLNPSLYKIACSGAQLTYLNLANGNNTNFTFADASGNPNLTCVQVDDSTYSANNWNNPPFFVFDAAANLSESCQAPCIVNIPDVNFKNNLINNVAINTNGDTEIQCSEASAYTGQISVSGLGISDLTGIEAFTSITDLICSNNSMTSLDVSNNPLLGNLDCSYNQLSTLDLSNNSSMANLRCFNNQLTSLNVANCTALSVLFCDNNELTSLNISNNSALEALRCNVNQLTSLDVDANVLLSFFWCYDNQLSTIDVSNNIALSTFRCDQNQITNLDLSNNSTLTDLRCFQNDLNSLNVANGNNASLGVLVTYDNPNLYCIQVDDSTYSVNNWTGGNYVIDAQSYYNEDCSSVSPILVVSITVQGQGGSDEITTNGGTLQMEATVIPTNATDGSYTWSVANGTGSATIDANGLLTASANGTVTVTATANDGSGVSGNKDITISNQGTAIKDVAFEGLAIYPNPTNEMVNIKVNEALSSIQLFDITGKIVKVFDATNTQLNVSDVQQGIYFLELKNNEKRSVVKLAIE